MLPFKYRAVQTFNGSFTLIERVDPRIRVFHPDYDPLYPYFNYRISYDSLEEAMTEVTQIEEILQTADEMAKYL